LILSKCCFLLFFDSLMGGRKLSGTSKMFWKSKSGCLTSVRIGRFALYADCVIVRYRNWERCKSIKISFLALLLLAGCTANGQYAGPFAPAQPVTPAELAASDDATCKSYGAVFGTTDYIQCREHLSDQRQANPRASANAQAAAMVDAPAATEAPAQTAIQPVKTKADSQMYCYKDGAETTCTPPQ
jgi:hypothetical protein